MSLPILGQNTKIDSLKGFIETGTKDTLMVSTLNELSVAYLGEGKFTESRDYSNQAIELASELNYLEGKAYALKNIGIVYYYEGEYITVFDYWTKSL